MSHWQTLLPGKILKVSYESLVSKQELVSRRLLKFCNLEWDPAVLHFFETERHVQTASQSQASHFVSEPTILMSRLDKS